MDSDDPSFQHIGCRFYSVLTSLASQCGMYGTIGLEDVFLVSIHHSEQPATRIPILLSKKITADIIFFSIVWVFNLEISIKSN